MMRSPLACTLSLRLLIVDGHEGLRKALAAWPQAKIQRCVVETCMKEQIQPGELTLHADRGSSMTAKPLALLLSDLSVTKTHSRPHVPDDNPFSESQFKTIIDICRSNAI